MDDDRLKEIASNNIRPYAVRLMKRELQGKRHLS